MTSVLTPAHKWPRVLEAEDKKGGVLGWRR